MSRFIELFHGWLVHDAIKCGNISIGKLFAVCSFYDSAQYDARFAKHFSAMAVLLR